MCPLQVAYLFQSIQCVQYNCVCSGIIVCNSENWAWYFSCGHMDVILIHDSHKIHSPTPTRQACECVGLMLCTFDSGNCIDLIVWMETTYDYPKRLCLASKVFYHAPKSRHWISYPNGDESDANTCIDLDAMFFFTFDMTNSHIFLTIHITLLYRYHIFTQLCKTIDAISEQ